MKRDKFNQLIKDIDRSRLKLLIGKSEDYADIDVLSNFKRMSKLCRILDINTERSPQDCALFLLVLKIDRWCNLRRKNTKPTNESIKDTVIDAHNYLDLAYGCGEELF